MSSFNNLSAWTILNMASSGFKSNEKDTILQSLSFHVVRVKRTDFKPLYINNRY